MMRHVRVAVPGTYPQSYSGRVYRPFRLFKQVLGWTAPKIRDPRAADRWTWLIICHAQFRLARALAADLRHPSGSGTAPPAAWLYPQPGSAGI